MQRHPKFCVFLRILGCGGRDLNQRPLGYESDNPSIFNKLENTDGTPNRCKEE
jgi:hypothetical protein